jgi:hypothetical protein
VIENLVRRVNLATSYFACAYRRIPSLSTTGTLIADLVDALSLLASTSESKGWQSLPRPGVECI